MSEGVKALAFFGYLVFVAMPIGLIGATVLTNRSKRRRGGWDDWDDEHKTWWCWYMLIACGVLLPFALIIGV